MINFKELWKGFIERQYVSLFGDKLKENEAEIEMLNEKLNVLLNDNISYEPEKLGEIGIAETTMLLAPFCPNVYLSDRMFGLCSVKEAKKFSIGTKVMCRKWLKEQHDCDEFSFALMGYWNDGLKQFAFGLAWSNYHAFNVMIDNEKRIWVIEPQTNKFIRIEDIKDNDMYYPLRVVMI